MEPGDDRPVRPSAPRSPASEEPEPDWVDAIRHGRTSRGDRLRRVFETFADVDPRSIEPLRPGVGPTEDEAK
jgi:hypothetical protein